jgi:peptidoglycan-associated lipoprotein
MGMRKVQIMLALSALVVAVGCASKEKKGDESGSGGMTGKGQGGYGAGSNNLQPVYFDFDKYDIRQDAKATLDEHVKYLKANMDVNIQLEGHCDERGSEEYNLALGERRALAVRDFLVNKGISSSRFTFISYGEERPVDPRHNETAWALNRRAEFVMYK